MYHFKVDHKDAFYDIDIPLIEDPKDLEVKEKPQE